MDSINPTEQECAPSPHPVVAYSGDAQSKGPETNIQFTGQVPESRPQPATPLSDITQARQLPTDVCQISIAGNGNTINYTNNLNSSKKKQKKKNKKDKKKKCDRSKGVQEGKKGSLRTSFTSEESKKKRKKGGIPCYPMSATPPGIALIINNEIFMDKRQKNRTGTNKDCEDIERVFHNFFGFRLVKKQNLTLAGMRQAFFDIQKEDHSSFDCFVAVIMSHGMMNGICGTDSNSKKPDAVLSVQEVFETIDKCSSLAGKPKLIFTQACRGEKSLTPQASQFDSPEVGKSDILTKSDFLFSYSTIEGHTSIRHPTHGTWYINSLCEVLREHAEDEDLNSMLTMLNKKVGEREAFKTIDGIPTKVKQTAEYTSRLTKKLFFKPFKRTQVSL